VSGSAALLLEKFPTASASEIKARLMNAANSTLYTNPATQPGVLAPISRIGAGEVRVNKAAAINTGVWDATNPYNVGLSFGTVRATGITTLQKKVAVRNYGSTPRLYAITRSFRYADDAASGAVTLSAPAAIVVPANGTASFVATLTIDASKLPDWNLAFVGDQGNGSLLQGVEFDGYVTLNDPAGSVSVPWHVLPHKASDIELGATTIPLSGGSNGSLALNNAAGATGALVDVYALVATSPQISTVLPAAGSNDVLIDLKAVGVRPIDVGELGVQFAVTTYGQRAHPSYPAEFDVYVDANGDGVYDYVVFTAEQGSLAAGGFATTGVTLVYAMPLNPDGSAAGPAVANFYADSDLNGSNMVLTVLGADIGITSPTQKFKFVVVAVDNYFTGSFKDATGVITHTLGKPKFSGDSDQLFLGVGDTASLQVSKVVGGASASPSQKGFLLFHSDGKTGREADAVTVTP